MPRVASASWTWPAGWSGSPAGGRCCPSIWSRACICCAIRSCARFGDAQLKELAECITDRNFRLFAENGALHVINGQMHLQGTDPFALFAEMQNRDAIDPSHAFYLGYEMAKALTALTLGKNYVQDQALNWGFLTRPEP